MEKLVPKLRFPEFNGDWSEFKLGNLFIMKSGSFVAANEIESLPNFNLYPCYGGNGLRGYTKTFTHEGKFNIIGRQGALCGNVKLVEGSFHATEHAVVVNNNKNQDTDFLFYILNNLNLNRLSTGQAQPGLSVTILNSVKFFTTLLPEQQKIASFLTSVDERISLLEKQKLGLEKYKKGVMQQLFSQQLRFKDEAGNDFPDWEEKKINEVFEITRGYVLAINEMKQIQSDEYKYPVYSSQTKFNGLTGFYKEFLYEDALTWTTDGANAGDVNFRSGKFYCTNVCGVLISKKGFANKCIAELLNSVTKKYVSYVGNPKLMNNTMGNIKLLFPCLEEQQKIATFLSEIDVRIEVVGKQLEQSKVFKKGLLQQLFV